MASAGPHPDAGSRARFSSCSGDGGCRACLPALSDQATLQEGGWHCVDEWVTGIGLRPEDYGTHSLRRTKASIIYKQTGNLRAVQILLGHTKIESTVRYLGVDVEDALTLSERTEI